MPVSKYNRNLPHWQQEGRTYFITFRLADSLPHAKLQQWTTERADWLRANPEPHSAEQQDEYEHQFNERFHAWLDAGYGGCWLRQPAISTLVESALRYFDGKRYQLGQFVIMPNHVHVLVTPLADWSVEQILHSWKSYSANQINDALKRTGPVWQHESFDRIVREEHALEKYEQYIRDNPRLAELA